MALDTIKRIQERVEHAQSISTEDKRALGDLLVQLETEVSSLPDSKDDEVRTLVGFTEVTAHEATKEQSDPTLMDLALDGMRTSVKRLQEQHPSLLSVVQDLASVLSRMGF